MEETLPQHNFNSQFRDTAPRDQHNLRGVWNVLFLKEKKRKDSYPQNMKLVNNPELMTGKNEKRNLLLNSLASGCLERKKRL